MKKCKKCLLTISLNCFGKHPENSDGLKGKCKKCVLEDDKEYKKSKSGLPKRMYDNQKTNSKRRGMPPPSYSNAELRAWLVSQPLYDDLYENWKNSGYSRDLTPSCDRVNDKLPYSLSNITLMTLEENVSKGHRMVRTTEIHNPTMLNGGHRSVEKWSKDQKTILDVYISQAEAARQNPHIQQANISKVCKKLLKSTGGFHWKFTGHTEGTK